MTRGSIQEYLQAVRGRYLSATKEEKKKILDEFARVTGYHRKSAIRALNRQSHIKRTEKRGRPRRYKSSVAGELKYLWEITDHLCSKRLHPFLPELLDVVKRNGSHVMSPEAETDLRALSPATMDRLLRTCHQKEGGAGFPLPGRERCSRTLSRSGPSRIGRKTLQAFSKWIRWRIAGTEWKGFIYTRYRQLM